MLVSGPIIVVDGTATGITKNGPGVLCLSSSANSYFGGGSIAINAGTLQATNPGALPNYNMAGYVTVSGGATLLLSAGGPGWSGANIGNLNTSGFQTGSILAVDTTGGSTTVSGAIAGNEGLIVQGSNTLTLNTVNTYTGGTTVNGGTLALVGGGSQGIIGGSLTINSGATVTADAQGWSLGYSTFLGSTPAPCVSAITINGGVLAFYDVVRHDNGSGGMAASSITMTGGTISGNFGWYDGVTTTPTLTTSAGTATAVISDGLTLRLDSGYLTFNVAQGNTANGVDLLVSGPIYNGQGGGIVKSGAGLLCLASNVNNYTGGTQINAGTLQATNPGALPRYGSAGGVTVSPGATLLLTAGAGWAGSDIGDLNTGGFQTGSVLGIDTTDWNTAVSASIGGNEMLLVQGSNTLILRGDNYYTGGTDVEGGTLEVMNSNAIPYETGLTAGTGGTVVFGDPSGTGATMVATSLHAASPAGSIAAVPEPGTLALLAVGALAAAFGVWRIGRSS